MRATLLLADAAQAVDGKLYVFGGGWSVTGPEPVATAIALKIDVPWDRANTPHRWRLELVDVDGRQVEIPEAGAVELEQEFEVGRPPGVKPGTSLDFVRDDKTNRIYLEHGRPIRFGENGEKGVRQLRNGTVEVFEGDDEPLVHDAHLEQPSLAFALSRLTQDSSGATPIGIFRNVEAPVYDDLMSEQLETSASQRGEGDLEALLKSGETWVVA